MFLGYPSDVTDAQWHILEPLLKDNPPKTGRKIWRDRRDVIDAIFYINKTGCQWRQLPVDFPPWGTVYTCFRKWKLDGTWGRVLQELNEKVRLQEGKNASPTYGILDSQSVKSSSPGEERAYDGHKKVKGRKRHILVDVLGLLLIIFVHAANIHDTKAAQVVMEKGLASYPSLEAFCGDEGYRKTAEEAAEGLGKVLHISKRIKDEFAVIPKRWVVERSFAWLNGSRRLSKDFETKTSSSEAMIQTAFVRINLNRIKY
jgi:putative transposase